MEAIREFVYSVLVVSVSGAVISMLAPENRGVSKYLNFLVSLAVTSVLLFPLCSVVGEFPELVSTDIGFHIKNADSSLYVKAVTDQACEKIVEELSDRLYGKFNIRPSRIIVSSNGDAEAMKIESVEVHYTNKRGLLYSDTVNFIKDILGNDCEVRVMYENS